MVVRDELSCGVWKNLTLSSLLLDLDTRIHNSLKNNDTSRIFCNNNKYK